MKRLVVHLNRNILNLFERRGFFVLENKHISYTIGFIILINSERVIGNFFILITSGVVLLLPVFFWMYIFAAFSHLGVSRKQFLLGAVAWSLATLPLLYSNMFIVWNLIEEIFFSLSFISESSFGTNVIWSIGLFFLVFALCSFWVSMVRSGKGQLNRYIVSLIGLLCILTIFTISMYLLSLIWPGYRWDTAIESGSFVFVWLIWISSYYIVISLLEEWMKYLSNLGIIDQSKLSNFSSMLASAAVVALGFAFFENILYGYSYITLQWIDGQLLQVLFFRSIFTVALHVLCAMLLAGGFYMLLNLRGKYNKAYVLFALFASISIVSHAFYDVALTFWYIWVVFIYLFLLYLLAGYITGSE